MLLDVKLFSSDTEIIPPEQGMESFKYSAPWSALFSLCCLKVKWKCYLLTRVQLFSTHMITHLETDILECKVKRAIGSITTNKARRDDGIPVELFQILKDDAVKVLHSICQQIWKTQQWPQDWKRSVFLPFHSNPKERQSQRMFKLLHNCTHVTH